MCVYIILRVSFVLYKNEYFVYYMNYTNNNVFCVVLCVCADACRFSICGVCM